MKFNTLPLSSDLVKNLEDNNFIECTEVQEQTIPLILEGKNLIIQAHTGTGKTAAFLIPLIEALLSKETKKKHSGLIVAPTRELALQIMEDAEILIGDTIDIAGVALYGGMNIEKQERQLKQAQFMVATPGRLLDFCNRQKNLLKDIDYFVLDECDRLFDMGFYPDLQKIMRLLPPSEERTSLLCSATLSEKVRQLARDNFHDTKEIDVSTTDLAVDKIKQEKIILLHKEKISMVLGLLKRMDDSQTAVIFTNTKHNAESLSLRLVYNGINSDYINGDLAQNRRQKVIQKFKDHKISVLVATDVAARGIHVHNLDLVINFDIPDDPQSYIHRIGRTGRAGLNGEAVTLVCDKFAYNLGPVESLLGHKIPQLEEDYRTLLVEDASAKIPNRDLKPSHKGSGSSRDRGGRDRDRQSDRRSGPRNNDRGDSRGGDRGYSRGNDRRSSPDRGANSRNYNDRDNRDGNRDNNRGYSRDNNRYDRNSSPDRNRDGNREYSRDRNSSPDRNRDGNRDNKREYSRDNRNRDGNREYSRDRNSSSPDRNRDGNRDNKREYSRDRNSSSRDDNRDKNRAYSRDNDTKQHRKGNDSDSYKKNNPYSAEDKEKNIDAITEKTLQKIEQSNANTTLENTPTSQRKEKTAGGFFSKLLKKNKKQEGPREQKTQRDSQHTTQHTNRGEGRQQSSNRSDDYNRKSSSHSDSRAGSRGNDRPGSNHRRRPEGSDSRSSNRDDRRNTSRSNSSENKYRTNRNTQNRSGARNNASGNTRFKDKQRDN